MKLGVPLKEPTSWMFVFYFMGFIPFLIPVASLAPIASLKASGSYTKMWLWLNTCTKMTPCEMVSNANTCATLGL